jgi:hypothetical protein
LTGDFCFIYLIQKKVDYKVNDNGTVKDQIEAGSHTPHYLKKKW